MRLMIASDIHGDAACCQAMLSAFQREKPDRLLLLGDLLYHGPRNPLPQDYDPQQVIRLLNEQKNHLLCVRGNCDCEVDQMVLDFPILAEYCLLYHKNRVLYVTHGHHACRQDPPPLGPRDILLHGHTHVPAWEDFGQGNLYLNPGSVSIPKENSPRGYLLLTDQEALWKDLAGQVYHRLAL